MSEIIIPEFPGLSFKDDSHTYFLDEIEIPSVTTVMNPLTDYEYRDVGDKTLENAANRGTAVHEAIENWIKFGIDGLDPELHGYMDGFLEWWNKYNPEPIASEIRVYHQILRYGGTVDLIAKINGKIFLVDFKTTYRLIDKNCRVQLEAYSQALGSHGVKIEKKAILHLTKTGKWDMPEFKAKDAEAWRVFGSLKCVYDYLHI